MSDFYGTGNNALTKMNMYGQFDRLVTFNNLEVLGNYSIQSACYDSTRNRFIIAAKSDSNNGQVKIVIVSDLKFGIYNPIVQTIVIAGHANDMCYDPIKDRILLVPGINGTTELPEGDTTAYEVREISPETGELLSVHTLPEFTTLGQSIVGIDYSNNKLYLYCWGGACWEYDLDFNRTRGMFNLSKQIISEYLGLTIAEFLRQGIFVYENYFYFPLNIMLSDFPRGFLIMRTNKFGRDFYCQGFCIPVSEEAEAIIVTDSDIYGITGSYFPSFYRYRRKFNLDLSDKNEYIPKDSDLNKYLMIGKYYSNNAANSQTILNYPEDCPAVGFTLIVNQQGSNNRSQILIPNHPYYKFYCYHRYYASTGNVAGWSPWTRLFPQEI